MHSASPNKKRHDVWQWYVDEESRTGRKTVKHGKVKVYCAQCLDVHKEALRETDEQSGDDRTDEERYMECKYILVALSTTLTILS